MCKNGVHRKTRPEKLHVLKHFQNEHIYMFNAAKGLNEVTIKVVSVKEKTHDQFIV